MTQLDVLYRYGVPPSESATLAMAKVREVYGVRRMDLDEAKKTVRVEYDATGGVDLIQPLDTHACRFNIGRILGQVLLQQPTDAPRGQARAVLVDEQGRQPACSSSRDRA